MSSTRNGNLIGRSAEPINSFTPLYARVQHHIRERISSGDLKPGDRLPSEPELATQFETTRATVARALQELVFDGTIVRKAGSGTYVGPGPDRSLDASRLLSFEEQMEKAGTKVEHRLIDFSKMDAPAKVASRLRLSPGSTVFHLQRQRLVKTQVVGLELRYIPADLGSKFTKEMLRRLSVHEILQDVLKLPIVRMEFSVRAAVATPRIAEQLQVNKGRPVLVREHTLIGPDERRLVYGEAIYREDFSFNYVADQSSGQPVHLVRTPSN